VNYVTLLLFSLIALFVLGLMFVPFAGAYQMDLLWQWSDKPNVCIWDNKYNHLFAKGFTEWNEALYSLGEEWVLQGKIVNGSTSAEIIQYCHINLILLEYSITEKEEFNGVIGRTSYTIPKDTSQTSRVFAVIYEERDSAHYFNFDDAIVKTVKHELGHAFGLGHWVPENTYEGLRPCLLFLD